MKSTALLFAVMSALLFCWNACSDDEEAAGDQDAAGDTTGDLGATEDSSEDTAADATEDTAADANEDTAADANEDTAADANEDTAADATEDTTADATEDAAADTGEDVADDVSGEADAIEMGTLSIEGAFGLSDAPIDPPIAADVGGYMVLLLPGGYVLVGDPAADVLAVAMFRTPEAYVGDALAIGDPVVLKVWEIENDNPISQDDWVGPAGTYSIFIAFMPDFEADTGPSHLDGPTDYELDSMPATIDFVQVILEPTAE